MICPKCEFQYDEGSKFCSKCGISLQGETANTSEVIIETNDNSNNEYYRNDKRKDNIYNEFSNLKPYYQIEFTKIKNSDEVYKGRFNFCAFLFSWIWMFTKKMYVGAIVYMIAVGILVNYVNSIFSLIFAILIGLRANYMYYNYYIKNTYKLW